MRPSTKLLLLLNRRATYSDKLRALFGTALIGYWKLAESSGTTAIDSSGNGRNGTTSGALVGQPGIGDGGTSYWFDGINDTVNFASSGVLPVFNTSAGTFLVWLKANAAADWTDGVYRSIIQFEADANNYITIAKSNSNNLLKLALRGNSTFAGYDKTSFSPTAWFHVTATWSIANNRTQMSINGGTFASGTMFASFVGALTIGRIGANVLGSVAHFAILNREATQAEATQAATL